MNRRHFLAVSTASTALAATASASARPSKELKVIIPAMKPDELADLKAVAPGVRLVECKDEQAAIAHAGDTDASYAFLSPAVIRAGKSLRWVQQPSAGVEHLMEIPELVQSDIVLTNMQRAYGPEIADQAMGYLLCFTRSLTHFVRNQSKEEWRSSGPSIVLDELAGKTLLVIALGGIGTEIARRAAAFGMRSSGYRPQGLRAPEFCRRAAPAGCVLIIVAASRRGGKRRASDQGIAKDDR